MSGSEQAAAAGPGAPAGLSAESRPRPPREMILCGFLWLMLWGGYNTDYGRLLVPGFPRNSLDLFHGVRSLFPILAGWVAILTLLARGSRSPRTFGGPVGLLAGYALIGIISSLIASPDPLNAFYWAAEYASVILVIWVSLNQVDPLPHLVGLIKLNWFIAILLASVLLCIILFDPNVKFSGPGLLLFQNQSGGSSSSQAILGMPTTRNTGIAKYAAIAALAALNQVWEGGALSRILWSLGLLFSVYGLIAMQARTSLIAFLLGGALLLWLRRSLRPLFFIWVPVGGLLLVLTGYYKSAWLYGTHGAGAFDPTLTGRTATWMGGWELFKDSPWLGFGFQADRLMLAGQHMHDALFQALVQTGLLGTIPFLAASVGAWILVFRLLQARRLPGLPPLPVEIPAVLAFVTIASITESTIAFFGNIWLFSAPLLAYLQALSWEHGRARLAIGRPLLPWTRLVQPGPVVGSPPGG